MRWIGVAVVVVLSLILSQFTAEAQKARLNQGGDDPRRHPAERELRYQCVGCPVVP